MYAQLLYFDGPRSSELLAAEDFASEHRLKPTLAQVAGMLGGYVLRRADGSEIVISLAESEQALLDGQRAVLGTHLLPGEDPALLPGPDRIEIYPVVQRFGAREEQGR